MRHTFVPRNCLIINLVLALSHFAPAQNKELTADESIPFPKVEFDAQGELKITASPNSSPNDFDFLVGKWKMHNRHLDKRLANCRDWTEFDSSDVNTKILNGAADDFKTSLAISKAKQFSARKTGHLPADSRFGIDDYDTLHSSTNSDAAAWILANQSGAVGPKKKR
jgi:hypothetical protein